MSSELIIAAAFCCSFVLACTVVKLGLLIDESPAGTVFFLTIGGWGLLLIIGVMFAFVWLVEDVIGLRKPS